MVVELVVHVIDRHRALGEHVQNHRSNGRSLRRSGDRVGNRALLDEYDIEVPEDVATYVREREEAGETAVHVVLDGTIIAYRWLPANRATLDRELKRARREWAIIRVVFAVVAVPIYGVITFLLGMLVFFV